jgi:hypothetical protein
MPAFLVFHGVAVGLPSHLIMEPAMCHMALFAEIHSLLEIAFGHFMIADRRTKLICLLLPEEEGGQIFKALLIVKPHSDRETSIIGALGAYDRQRVSHEAPPTAFSIPTGFMARTLNRLRSLNWSFSLRPQHRRVHPEIKR